MNGIAYRHPLLRIVGLLVAIGVPTLGAAWSFAVGDWGLGLRAAGAAIVFFWVVGPVQEVRARTTDRLSRAQGLAGVLVLLGSYVGLSAALTGSGLIVGAVAIVLLFIWLVKTLMTEGWSRHPD